MILIIVTFAREVAYKFKFKPSFDLEFMLNDGLYL